MTMFDQAALIDEAVRIAGTDDFGPDDFRPAMAQLLSSYDGDMRLNEQGVRKYSAWFVQWLVDRAWAIEALRRHPQIAEVPITRPIVIAGLPRAGTTMLSRLLGEDPGNRTPVLWELYSPVDPPGMAAAEARQLAIQRAQALVDGIRRSDSELSTVHPMDAQFPEEDDWLMRRAFLSPTLPILSYLPSYFAWLHGQDLTPAYQWWRRLLQLILWRVPGKQLVMKNPLHFYGLAALGAVAPDALVVMLHRDVQQQMASTCSMIWQAQKLTNPTIEPESVGPYVLTNFPQMVDRMLEFRSSPHHLEIIDIQYRDLMRDPMAIVGQIYDRLGRKVDAEGALAMKGWLENNPHHTAPKHRYSLADFNLEPQAVRRAMQAYSDRFIEPAAGRSPDATG